MHIVVLSVSTQFSTVPLTSRLLASGLRTDILLRRQRQAAQTLKLRTTRALCTHMRHNVCSESQLAVRLLGIYGCRMFWGFCVVGVQCSRTHPFCNRLSTSPPKP